MTRFILRFCNGLITFLVVVSLVVCTAYAGYALWDNQQVYDAVENVMDELRDIRAQMETSPAQLKGISGLIAAQATEVPQAAPVEAVAAVPATGTTETVETGGVVSATGTAEEAQAVTVTVTQAPAAAEAEVTESAAKNQNENQENREQVLPTEETKDEPEDLTPFGQLHAINPDITAWITMPGTAIDYPVLQGRSNMTYINTDVYGEFALAGSIYLDSRNDRNYQDIYSLLYGHNMSKHRMFSDVNLYKDEEFFKENHLGMLLMEDGGHLLQSLSCILTSAGNSGIFNPDNWTNGTNEQRISIVLEDAVQVDQETLEILQNKMDAGEPYRIVALSTCSGEFTDARTILLTLMDP